MITARLTQVVGLLLVYCLFLIAGCANITPLESPKISLADIQVMEMKSLETTFLVNLRIANPNPDPLTVKGLNCNVEIEDHPFASGLQSVEKTIPPYGSILIPMKVYASMPDMFNSVLNILKSADEPGSAIAPIGYRITGKVGVSRGNSEQNLPFTAQGEMQL